MKNKQEKNSLKLLTIPPEKLWWQIVWWFLLVSSQGWFVPHTHPRLSHSFRVNLAFSSGFFALPFIIDIVWIDGTHNNSTNTIYKVHDNEHKIAYCLFSLAMYQIVNCKLPIENSTSNKIDSQSSIFIVVNVLCCSSVSLLCHLYRSSLSQQLRSSRTVFIFMFSLNSVNMFCLPHIHCLFDVLIDDFTFFSYLYASSSLYTMIFLWNMFFFHFYDCITTIFWVLTKFMILPLFIRFTS